MRRELYEPRLTNPVSALRAQLDMRGPWEYTHSLHELYKQTWLYEPLQRLAHLAADVPQAKGSERTQGVDAFLRGAVLSLTATGGYSHDVTLRRALYDAEPFVYTLQGSSKGPGQTKQGGRQQNNHSAMTPAYIARQRLHARCAEAFNTTAQFKYTVRHVSEELYQDEQVQTLFQYGFGLVHGLAKDTRVYQGMDFELDPPRIRAEAGLAELLGHLGLTARMHA